MTSINLVGGKMVDAWRHLPRDFRQLKAPVPGRPIFLTGTHRSGTTWFAKMLAPAGLWYVREPFNPVHRAWPKEFTYRSADSPDPRIDRFFHALLAGKYRALLGIPRTDLAICPLRWLPIRPNRILIKDPLACLLAEYLATRFELEPIILFRHPAAFVASVRRLRWPQSAFLRQFLDDQSLMNDHLHHYQRLIARYSEGDSIEAATVLCGCLNRVLWTAKERTGARVYIYGELCAAPVAAFRKIFEDLGLPYSQEVERTHHELCHDADGMEEYAVHGVRRVSIAMATRWRADLTPDDVKRIRDIWLQFDVPLYGRADDWTLEC